MLKETFLLLVSTLFNREEESIDKLFITNKSQSLIIHKAAVSQTHLSSDNRSAPDVTHLTDTFNVGT